MICSADWGVTASSYHPSSIECMQDQDVSRPPPARSGRPVAAAVVAVLGLASPPALSIMAGSVPDSAAARIDANTGDSPWTSAVAVIVNGGIYSGVVVAPQHVLTAAHVVGAWPPTALSVQLNPGTVPVTRHVTAVQRFPSYSFPYDDLALLTLGDMVPDTVRVLPIYRQGLPPAQSLILVGHGYSGLGDVGASVPGVASTKRRGMNAADAVQTTVDTSGRSSLFYLFDFDGPTGAGALGGPTLGNTVETGLAGGDSGSPAYAEIGGSRWLVGINNLVSPAPGSTQVNYRFGTLGGGILLSDPRFIDWLQSATQGSLGQQPASHGDVPLPGWALGLLAASLGVAQRRRRAGARSTDPVPVDGDARPPAS